MRHAWTQLSGLRRILAAEDYRQFSLLILAMFVSALLQVVGIASILPFMHLVARPEAIEEVEWLAWAFRAFGFESRVQMLFWTGGLVFVAFSSSVVVSLFVRWFIQHSAWATAHRLCMRQLTIYLQLPYEFFLRNTSAELLRRVVADINLLLSDVLMAGSQLLAQTALAFGMIALMLSVSSTLTLIALLVFGGIYFGLHVLRHRLIVRLSVRRIEKDNERYTAFIDAIAGLKAIRTSSASAYFLDRFASASEAYSRLHPKFDLAIGVPRYLMETIAAAGILVILLNLVAQGGDFTATVPTIAFFVAAFYRLMPAVHGMFDCAARLSKGLPTVESIARDMRPQSALEPFDGSVQGRSFAFERELRLTGATFRYAGAKVPTLHEIEATIRKGERVAVVGQTGSGKTTLIDVVVGLLQLEQGRLTVDGRPVDRGSVASWRRHVAYVPQDVFLYDSSVADNIVFGLGAPDEERLRWAARIAQIDAFVVGEMPNGYATGVGERGVRLSGGQRQRIGIARALYRRPALLVLDEATSALDGETERSVLAAIAAGLPEVTVLMVTHRLATVRDCDRILLLHRGRLEQAGTFEELHRASAVFRSIAATGGEATPATESAK